MDKNSLAVPTAADEKEDDGLYVEDILESDAVFNAFMGQVFALKTTVEAYVESVEVVPSYTTALVDSLDELIVYMMQELQDYVEDYNADIIGFSGTQTLSDEEEDNSNG